MPFFSGLALEGGACEAGGPGPRGGFLLPYVLSPQRLPCPGSGMDRGELQSI